MFFIVLESRIEYLSWVHLTTCSCLRLIRQWTGAKIGNGSKYVILWDSYYSRARIYQGYTEFSTKLISQKLKPSSKVLKLAYLHSKMVLCWLGRQ